MGVTFGVISGLFGGYLGIQGLYIEGLYRGIKLYPLSQPSNRNPKLAAMSSST